MLFKKPPPILAGQVWNFHKTRSREKIIRAVPRSIVTAKRLFGFASFEVEIMPTRVTVPFVNSYFAFSMVTPLSTASIGTTEK